MPIQQMYISVCNFPSGAKPQTVEEPKLNYNKGECVHFLYVISPVVLNHKQWKNQS